MENGIKMKKLKNFARKMNSMIYIYEMKPSLLKNAANFEFEVLIILVLFPYNSPVIFGNRYYDI